MADDVNAPPGLVPLAKGREAEVFVREDGDVVKVMFSASQEPRVLREAAALQALADREHLAPAFREITEVDGRPALVTERVAGEDFLTLLSKKPWLVLNVAGTLGRAHAAMHRHQAPDSLPELNHELGRRIEAAKALPQNLAAEALRRLQTLPSDDRLCHGDFHPANILGTLAAPVIIDWVTPRAVLRQPTLHAPCSFCASANSHQTRRHQCERSPPSVEGCSLGATSPSIAARHWSPLRGLTTGCSCGPPPGSTKRSKSNTRAWYSYSRRAHQWSRRDQAGRPRFASIDRTFDEEVAR